LRFIDGHGKGQPDGKLESLELVWHICGNAGNAWDEGILTLGTPGHDLGLNDVGQKLLHAKSGTIAQSWWVQVFQEHYWRSNFKDQVMQWQAWWLQRVEELSRVEYGLIRLKDGANGLVRSIRTWQLLKNAAVDLLQHVILRCKDGPLT
jgi:hypothetical protein